MNRSLSRLSLVPVHPAVEASVASWRGELLSDVAAWLDDYNELEQILDCREKIAFADISNGLSAQSPQRRKGQTGCEARP